MQLFELPYTTQLIVGAGIAIFGLVFLGLMRRGIRQASESARWPCVSGTVLATSVRHDEHYFPVVTYRYEFGGKKYVGSRLSVFERGYTFASSAEAETSRFSPGQSVPVYVNPAAPNQAVLQPGSNSGLAGVMATCGALIAGFGLWVLVSGLLRGQ